MILPAEYSWLESYLDTDTFWLDDSLNWEEVFTLALSDVTIYNFLITPFFVTNNLFIDSFVKLSFLDLIFMLETNKTTFSREIYDLFLWDVSSFIHSKFLTLQFLYYTDYQDYLVLILHYSPELSLALLDYITTYWTNSTAHYVPSIVFDLFSDALNATLSEFTEYLILFFFFFWLVIFFINIFHLIKWNNALEIYMVRNYYYLYAAAKETRVQFEAFLQTFFFFVFYWSMLIATFDDDREELIELFDTGFFYFFCILIFFLLYRYSVHYFAFLEASVTEGRSVSYITKQFFRDFINTFALLLRFFILLFRLNVYDTLDDFYDSYYIFVGDFDDDEYFSELFFSMYPLIFFDYDVNDDRSWSLEDESEFMIDLFYIYFLCWAKFFTFIFFILEEILRLSLGFYICYLIIFEVHSVNASYTEDTFFQSTKAYWSNTKFFGSSFFN